MRIFLTILLVLAVLLGLVCLSAVSVALRFWGGRFEWCVRYCGIRILPRPKKLGSKRKRNNSKWKLKKPEFKKKKTTPEKKKAPPEEITEAEPSGQVLEPSATEQEASAPEQEAPASEQDMSDTGQKKDKLYRMDRLWKRLQGLAEKADFVDTVLYAVAGPMKRLIRGISWYAIETDILIGGEDAAACARLYGTIYSLFEPLFGTSGHFIKVKRKKIAVACDFTADTCQWNVSCRFSIRIGTLIAFGIGLVWKYFTDRIKNKKQFSGKRL